VLVLDNKTRNFNFTEIVITLINKFYALYTWKKGIFRIKGSRYYLSFLLGSRGIEYGRKGKRLAETMTWPLVVSF